MRNEPTRESLFWFALAGLWLKAALPVFFIAFCSSSFGNGFNRGNAFTRGSEDKESEDEGFATAARFSAAIGPVSPLAGELACDRWCVGRTALEVEPDMADWELALPAPPSNWFEREAIGVARASGEGISFGFGEAGLGANVAGVEGDADVDAGAVVGWGALADAELTAGGVTRSLNA